MTAKGDPHVLFRVDEEVGRAFFWLSTGLAVLTAFLQGLVTATALMTEASNQWTFRFRLALLEHWWWATVSILLLVSLVMVALSFASGNGGDQISVLALSSATFLATVQFTIPAWRLRFYTRTRWLAWAGPSRTAIQRGKQAFCGDAKAWNRLVAENDRSLTELQPTPSDHYGWRLWPISGIAWDPTDVLNVIDSKATGKIDIESGQSPVGVYINDDTKSNNVSLLWGPHLGFRRRISRAVSSMPLGLLRSNPSTVDGYDGKGLTMAMGILGRNKGLQPWKLVFKSNSAVSSHMEATSLWAPRPAKVLRSFYRSTLNAQYGGLGEDYVNAAVELALLLSDIPSWAANKWLYNSLEHQSLQINAFLAETALHEATAEERQAALNAHYESSYVSMIILLNYMNSEMKNKRESKNARIARPDLLCVGILLKARNQSLPSWWKLEAVRQQVEIETECLSRDLDWKFSMARLLGLDSWPIGFEHSHW